MTLLKDSPATNLQLIGQATDPAVNPAAGNYKFYILDDDTVWIMDDAGVSTQLAAGSGIVYETLNFVIDGGGSEIADGIKGDVYFETAFTLTAWTILADQSGAIKIDLWLDTYANYPPTDADSITNAHEPEIAASAVKAQDTDLSDWTDTTIAAGKSLRVNVDSCTTITRATLALKLLRS